MKKLLVLGVLGAILLGFPMTLTAYDRSPVEIEIDGKKLDLKTPSVIQNGITMVPLRALAVSL